MRKPNKKFERRDRRTNLFPVTIHKFRSKISNEKNNHDEHADNFEKHYLPIQHERR